MAFVRRRSGWVIQDSSFYEFQAEAADWRIWEGDGFGAKGVQQIVLERQDTRLILLNTHLQSEYGEPKYTDIRSRQLHELRRVAERVPRHRPVIATGDFNTTPEEQNVYPALVDYWADLGEAVRRRCVCGTYYTDGQEAGWIDYILARRNDDWEARASDFEIIRNSSSDDPYSDHHGLLATVELRNSVTPSFPLLGLVLMGAGRPTTRRQWFLATLMAVREITRPLAP